MSKSQKGRVAHNKGKKMSEEQRSKMSVALTGLKRSPEVRARLRGRVGGGMTGKKHSEESKVKMVISHIGKVLPSEQKKKIGLAQKGKILYRDKDGNFCSRDNAVKSQVIGG
jgi:hypothetical protein